MLRPPTIKKLPRGISTNNANSNSTNNLPQKEVSSNKKPISSNNIAKKPVSIKHIPKPTPNKHETIPNKVQRLEQAIQKLQDKTSNSELQQILIRQIQSIKNQLIEIKHKIGMQSQNQQPQHYQQPQENIYQNKHQHKHHQQPKQEIKVGKIAARHNKPLLDIGKIQPYLKQFKVETTGQVLPYYSGYHKKSSKAVIIKYCPQQYSIEPILNIYEKLWKNIVKAKKICINKIYDINQPLAQNIMVIEANKYGLQGIKNQMPHRNLIVQILKCLQFIHQCGYLYRNIRPQHIMMSYEGNIVLIDFKRAKKFVDNRGKLLQVRRGMVQTTTLFENYKQEIDQFSSNSQVCFLNEGRKDDLQSLGYLALFLLEGCLPWNQQNIIKMRPKLTLHQLYGQYPNLLSYMIAIHNMKTEDTPNYESLANLIMQ